MLRINQIEFNQDERRFSEEMSTLEATGSVDDKSTICGRMIKIQTDDEKYVIYFKCIKTHTDGEGSITHWEFVPTQVSTEIVPQARGWQFVVFND